MRYIRAISCLLVSGVVGEGHIFDYHDRALNYRTSVSGLADFIQDSMVTVDRSAPADGRGGYYNEPSPLYASAAGEVAALFSAVLNVWCVLLAFVKLWYVKLTVIKGLTVG